MTAAYSQYDYMAYWKDRRYEHESEVIAIRNFLSKIPKANKILEGGCGYGRLVNYYIHRGKKIVLTDPCSTLLTHAKKRLNGQKEFTKKVTYVQSRIENLDKKFKKNSFDLILMVRVMHHLKDADKAFSVLEKLLKPKGYLILEFANKKHSKALLKNFLHGNLTFPFDIFPLDKRSNLNIKNGSIPFYNYHPDMITESLKTHNFEIIEKRSVSNIRSNFIKKHIPLDLMLKLEETSQTTLAKTNFGPSIFLLLQKK